jgi:hypothetical protein
VFSATRKIRRQKLSIGAFEKGGETLGRIDPLCSGVDGARFVIFAPIGD